MAEKDKYGKIHDKEVAALLREIDGLYSDLADTVGFIGVTSASSVDKNVPFSLSDYPAIKARIDKALAKLAKKLGIAIVNGVRSQWTLANKKNDELCRVVFGALINSITDAQRRQYFNNNQKALEAFLKRKDSGLLLSQKVWNYVNEGRLEIESTLELGIKTGQSAAEMARDLKQYLKFPDKLFRRVRDEEGNLHLSKAAKEFHPGQGVYRSSYKNARRLAATETNMAYRSADHARHMQLDFIVGIRINLSNNHTCLDRNGKPQPFYDICDELRGDYPKWFDFKGWHPLCYDDKSEVYTEKGWKLFADVSFEDRILSLNPKTMETEYADIVDMQCYPFAGNLVSFKNNSLDILVTPEHRIVYLGNKSLEIEYCTADEYEQERGAMLTMEKAHGNKEWMVSECSSAVLKKTYVPYNGNVYDLSLDKNHIMLIERNGHIFWGSNCRCFVTTILKTDEEVDRDSDGVDRGSVNEVKEMPPQWREWLERNHDRIDRAEARGTLPYFLRDNEEAWRGGFDSRKEYDNYDEDKLEKVLYDKESGGYLVVDRKRAESGSVNKQEKSKFEKELNMAMVYARNGYKIQMLEEVPRISSPDVLINGVPADLKKVVANSIEKLARKAIKKQGAEVVLFQFDEMTHQIGIELNKLRNLGIRYKYFITGEEKVYSR